MSDPFIRTQTALNDCEQHLQDSGAIGSPIEAYLTEYLLILMCADMQEAIYRIIEEWAEISANPSLKEFVAASSRRVLRSVKKGEIAGFVGLFGSTHKDRFNSVLDDREVTIYNNAVESRHDVAHRTGATVTFSDMKDALSAARNILVALERALS
jgi:ABC-type sugar transport system ATPase subunit